MWVCLLQGLHSSPLNGLFGTQSLFPHRNSFINDGWEPRAFTETSLLQSYPAGDFWVGKTQLGTGLPFVPLLNQPYRPWEVSVSLKEDPSMIGAWSSVGRGKCYMRGPTPCSALLPAGDRLLSSPVLGGVSLVGERNRCLIASLGSWFLTKSVRLLVSENLTWVEIREQFFKGHFFCILL